MKKNFCFDCDVELTPENTEQFGGLDEYNYNWAKAISPGLVDSFIKCDDCFERQIDYSLERI